MLNLLLQPVSVATKDVNRSKGVGKVWQITARDAACSYGVAWLLPAFTAAGRTPAELFWGAATVAS